MTAVEWLEKELNEKGKLTPVDFYQAKAMEKQQIKDAWDNGAYGSGEFMINIETSQEYYNETYGSNGNDETKTNNMKTGTSSLMDSHLVDFSNKNAHLIKSNSTTSSQTEISDEEIEDAIMYMDRIEGSIWKAGAKWYREQLKSRR